MDTEQLTVGDWVLMEYRNWFHQVGENPDYPYCRKIGQIVSIEPRNHNGEIARVVLTDELDYFATDIRKISEEEAALWILSN